MQIFPTPKSDILTGGSFTLPAKLTFYINKGFSNKRFIDYAPKLWKDFTCGYSSLEITECDIPSGTSLISETYITPVNAVGEYEYVLDITEKCVSMSYTEDIGLIHAFCTLLMTIETKTEGVYAADCRRICDKPDLKMRAVHLCVFPETTLDFLEKSAVLCAFFKYTHVVIEFWGMFKYEFTDILSWAEAYDKNDIAPILEKLRALGCEPVPMFNFFGHASQGRVTCGKHATLDRFPEKEYMFESDGWAWRVDNPEVYDFLEKAVTELCEVFGEGEYFHFGCDEVYSIARRENPSAFLAWHFNNICATAKKLGRKPLAWGDMLIDHSKIKGNVNGDKELTAYKAINEISRDIVICDWQYVMKEGECKTGEYFKDNGFTTLLCPWVLSKANIRFLCTEAHRLGLEGVLFTTWHTMNNNFDCFSAAGEYMWNHELTDVYRPFYTTTAALIRKLVPCGGDTVKAGWVDKQIVTGSLTL